MASILLVAINARYSHSSFGLRYLQANLGPLASETKILEFDLTAIPLNMVETLLAYQPKIIGLGVYIWNVVLCEQVTKLLKRIAPTCHIILGGPEISYETESQAITQWADYVIQGEGEVQFAKLCYDLLIGQTPPSQKILPPHLPLVTKINLPYDFYTEEDIAHRLIYVESSRGCPFRCHFCLSSLDQKLRFFPLDAFLTHIQSLYDRGVRQFKFVDRTFNLDVRRAEAILDKLLAWCEDDKLFVHFEVVPDRLPSALKERLQQFPPGSLQLEVGIQTFTQEVQARIERKQESQATWENLAWLRRETHAHLHADLIFGLPGETLESFADSFDQLMTLDPHDIQVGILKRLRGTPIRDHTDAFGMVYNPSPPYDLLFNHQVDFITMQRIKRFARYWDMIGNRHYFSHTRATIGSQPSPFAAFLALSDWIYQKCQRTHEIALKSLYQMVAEGFQEVLSLTQEQSQAVIEQDQAIHALKKKSSNTKNLPC